MLPWSSSKAKVQLRLSVQRLRTLQQKKEAQAKASRRDIALLIERGKVETARIKVEALINEDIYVELLELLELYCELLLARFGLLDQNSREPDPGVNEGICAIIHAAPRTEIKELNILREILMHKYGREFSVAVMENRDGCVSDRIMRKLTIATPAVPLVDAYMGEIAKAYGVEWAPPGRAAEPSTQSDGGDKEQVEDTLDAEIKIPDLSADAAEASPPKLPDPPPTYDAAKNDPGSTKSNEASASTSKPTTSRQSPEEDDFDALARRFAALKKK